ncbi:MAG: hypothetical protein V1489_00830 [Candidatus Liptonbacteria bacterium]
MIDKSRCMFVTSTYYPDPNDVRAKLACETARNAVGLGYTILTVDDGSHPAAVENMAKARMVILFADAKGNANCRPQAFRAGWELVRDYDGAVCFLEAEKTDLPKEAHPGFERILDGWADLVNFNRTKRAHRTYPAFQRYTESAGNEILHLILMKDAPRFRPDGFYGGRAVGKGGIEYFANPDETVKKFAGNWGITHLPMLKMVRDGMRVATLDVNIEYPPAQRAAEENDLTMALRRVTQLVSLTEGTLAYAEAIGLVSADTLKTAREKLKFGMPK